MTFEEMQAVLSDILQVQRQLQEKHLRAMERMTRSEDKTARFEDNMTRLEEGLAETKKIVERNARSILANSEAIDNQLRKLIQIVGGCAEATNDRLDIPENQASDDFE